MTHAPETGAINRLHFSGAGFWYVRHSNHSSGTRYRRRLEHCSISKPESGVHVTEMIIYDFIPLQLNFAYNTGSISARRLGEFTVYVAFSRVYFRRQKFSFQAYMVRKTDARKWSRLTVPVSWGCVIAITIKKYQIAYAKCVDVPGQITGWYSAWLTAAAVPWRPFQLPTRVTIRSLLR